MSDQVIIDRKKLEQLEDLNSQENLLLRAENKELIKEIESIKENRIIVKKEIHRLSMIEKLTTYIPIDQNDVIEKNEKLFKECNQLRDRNRQLKSRNLFDYIFKRKLS